ncbi:CHAT domain-containing protein [Streptomyces sp. NPDC057705]|uniref:CHAT domain-containing protein n=1 Tax=Streptomyces sp. NPDC057705 TaxID=3346222 RepID=UPI0036C20478
MSFDELLRRVQQRLTAYQQAGTATIVTGESSLAEAAELWRAAQPPDPGSITPEEVRRLATARHALGWLFLMRCGASLAGPFQLELARAIVFLAPVAGDAASVPEPVRAVLGPNSDFDQQSDLANEFLRVARTSDDPYLLEAVILLLTEAVEAAPAVHPRRAGILNDLGVAHTRRFERLGRPADLERSIEVGEQVVAAPAAPSERAKHLNNLGGAYQMRYAQSGMTADLERSIEVGEQAIAIGSADDPLRAERLCNLGISYRERFGRTGIAADLDRAVELGEQALATAPDQPGSDRVNRAVILTGLGGTYHERFERTRAAADLTRAVELGEQALAATPPRHPHRAVMLSKLSGAYDRRFERNGVEADLERAIQLAEQAVAAAAAGDPHRPGMLANLAVGYLRRVRRTGVGVDLARAVELGEQALAATPQDHPNRAGILSGLAAAYRERFERTGQGVGPDTLRTLAAQTASATASTPQMRVHAAGIVGVLAHALNANAIAVQSLDAAVAMMPLIAPREGTWEDQEYTLGEHPGLVGEAVAAHCAVGDYAGAVEIAELGRGVLLAAQIDSRTDLTDLAEAHPELAGRFRQVRDRLAAPTSRDDIPAIGVIEDRKRLWGEHDEVLTQIRQRPDFARFLLPPRLADLQPAAAEGVVVLVNASLHRSDAIIVANDASPVHVPLPDLTLEDTLSRTRDLLAATHGASPLVGALRRRRLFADLLAWLWTSLVEPVLHALPVVDEEPLPRVWWLPTGVLGLFPLHAAGLPGQAGALDRVVSSYTPTLRALAYARARPATTTRHQLTVALTRTPGLPDLPGSVTEAIALRSHHNDARALVDEDATTAHVLAALSEATWAHFACHASADPVAPSRGGLHLHNGTLPLPDISRLQLPNAELAYLSACSTAHGGARHADESLHLASAFHLAGYRHAIASLWPLDDDIAASAAAAFYRHLPGTATAGDAATVLHSVIRNLRAEHPDRPDLWAALIHSGP